MKRKNSAKGRDSYDAEIGNDVVPFFNRNITPYPTEAGGPKFDLIPVTKQKDIMINNARLFARQEYDRIMELVEVLQRQAAEIKRRLDITDLVHSCEYQFQIIMGKNYWVVRDKRNNKNILTHTGPNDWTTGAPENYEYLVQVQYLGDHTWMEIKGA